MKKQTANHNTSDGFCCACEADIAFWGKDVKESFQKGYTKGLNKALKDEEKRVDKVIDSMNKSYKEKLINKIETEIDYCDIDCKKKCYDCGRAQAVEDIIKLIKEL